MAEVTNQTILRGLRTTLDEAKGKWADELLSVLWAYHITPRIATGETPFNMTFDIEAVISIEIGLLTLQIDNFKEEANSEQLRANVDLLEET